MVAKLFKGLQPTVSDCLVALVSLGGIGVILGTLFGFSLRLYVGFVGRPSRIRVVLVTVGTEFGRSSLGVTCRFGVASRENAVFRPTLTDAESYQCRADERLNGRSASPIRPDGTREQYATRQESERPVPTAFADIRGGIQCTRPDAYRLAPLVLGFVCLSTCVDIVVTLYSCQPFVRYAEKLRSGDG